MLCRYQELMGEAVTASKAQPTKQKDAGFFSESNLTNLFGQLETLVQVTSPEVTIPEVCACVCVSESACACVCACVCLCGRVLVRVCACACACVCACSCVCACACVRGQSYHPLSTPGYPDQTANRCPKGPLSCFSSTAVVSSSSKMQVRIVINRITNG